MALQVAAGVAVAGGVCLLLKEIEAITNSFVQWVEENIVSLPECDQKEFRKFALNLGNLFRTTFGIFRERNTQDLTPEQKKEIIEVQTSVANAALNAATKEIQRLICSRHDDPNSPVRRMLNEMMSQVEQVSAEVRAKAHDAAVA